ncbi:MAG: bile acid:sodium symporter family protein, partial [Saprospiraceae bacterium]
GAAGMIRAFDISFVEMARLILLLIVAPLAVGMWMTARLPAFTSRIRAWMQRLSLFAFFGILVGALAGNLSNLAEYLRFVFVIVALHNALALAGGYSVGAAFGLSKQDRRTLSIESGVHNTALGLVLIFQFFNGLGGMVLIAAWWGIWDLVTGIALAYYWRTNP